MKKLNNSMGKVMTFLMLNCDKATFLLSKREITDLKCVESFKLKMHLLTCSYCRVFAQQSAIISKHVQTYKTINPNNLKLKLTDDQKICMQHKIDSQLNIK